MKFAVSLVAFRKDFSGYQYGHATQMIDATSLDEAVGKGWRAIRNLFPNRTGWQHIDIIVIDPNLSSVDPDNLQEYQP